MSRSRERKTRSVRSRLLTAFLAPSLLLFALAGTGTYYGARQILEDELGRSLSAQAAAAASQLSAERLLTLEPGDETSQTRTYRNLLRTVEEIRVATQARRVFAFDARGRMRLDTLHALPLGTEIPELARDRLELSRVMAGKLAQSQVLFEGSDGRVYKTGYAPLWRGSDVVGAVGVEGDAAFFRPLYRLSRGFIFFLALSLAVLAGMVVAVAGTLTRPLGRLLQSALRIGRGDLSTRVPGEPTREIGGLARELEAMRSALESRDRQLKMMLAGVAHEVRNPIGGIELFTGLLHEELPPSEARNHVERILREVDYLKRTVDEFLAFAREERLERAPTDAAQLGRQAAMRLEADARERRVVLSLELAEASLDVDASLIEPALVNLLKNALQASPEGGAVTLTGTRAADRYHFEVTDGGVGVPEGSRARIFEPFYTTREKGTGLGLPLARKLAEAHGGALTLVSAPRTTFRLELPCVLS